MPRSRQHWGSSQWTADDFFRGLPKDQLTEHEEALRLALIDFAEAVPGPFPLTEWIERRVGGELGLSRNDENGYDMYLVNRPEPEPAGGEIRPGDWTCPACGVNVFGSKDACFKCKEPKPAPRPPSPERSGGETRPGDWTCPACGAHVFGSKDACFKCKEPKPRPRSPSPERSGGETRPGDWTCPACGAHVFGSKDACFKCKEPKPRSRSPTPEPEPPGAEIRPGDWTCPACGVNVFASRDACFKCKEPKPRPRSSSPRRSRKSDVRPGDWSCPKCDNNVYASRDACPRCGTWKPSRYTRSNDKSQGYAQDDGEDSWGRVCTLFQSTGSCKYGDECKFSHDPEEISRAEDACREFLEALPDDEITDEEDRLRCSLLDVIESWPTDSVPTMKELLVLPEIKEAWVSVRPKNFILPISEWIECRIGQELQVERDNYGRVFIGAPGQLKGMKKRKAKEESHDAPAPKGTRKSE